MSGGEAKHAIGLMSGTSMDGIDVALLRTNGGDFVERGPAREYAFSQTQRERLEAAVEEGRGASDSHELRRALAGLEAAVTDWHAEAVERFEKDAGVTAAIIGFHGQTVTHRPAEGWTLQLGDGARLAERLGRSVVFDFRTADMEAGGQGAPLVPVYHAALAEPLISADRATISFLNIGGIANATVLRRGEAPIAFDCGPGNVLIDRWVARETSLPFDPGGRIASEGRIAVDWIEAQMAAPFFKLEGPRSLDRLDFELPASTAFDLADGARTLARFTAEAAAASLAPYEPDLTIVCGGGRANETLLADLRELIAGDVATAEAFGLDGGAMEAEAFAYLAVRCEMGLEITYPTTTGCRTAMSGGRLVRA